MRGRVRMTFSFSLYSVLLQVILVIYFGGELGLGKWLSLPKDGEMYYY